MYTLSPSTPKENVKLVGFSPNLNDQRKSSDRNVSSITITLNGTPCSEVLHPQTSHVKLVGFSRCDSFCPNDKSTNGVDSSDGKAGTSPKPSRQYKAGVNPQNEPTVTETTRVGPASTDKERREKLNRLTEETREWFAQMKREDETAKSADSSGKGNTWCADDGSLPKGFKGSRIGPNRIGNKNGFNDDVFRARSDRMRKFFDEARDKFSQCSSELFDKFVQENQDRFSQMLDEMANEESVFLRNRSGESQYPPGFNTRRQGYFGSPKSNGHSDHVRTPSSNVSAKSSGIFSDFDPSTSSQSGKQDPSSRPTTPGSSPKKTTNIPKSNSFSSGHFSSTTRSSTDSFSQSFDDTSSSSTLPTFSKNNSSFDGSSPFPSQQADETSADSNSNSCCFSSFPTFPAFPAFTSPQSFPKFPSMAPTTSVSTNSVPVVTSVTSFAGKATGTYQMSASKSTFEYCGNTDTYRFSTEQMSHNYEQSFDDVSESDDEYDDDDDDRETASTGGEPSEISDEISTIEGDLISPDSRRSLTLEEVENRIDKVNNVLHRIATELLTTERTYVNILHLIDLVFQFRVDNENRAHSMFPQDIVTQMFSNVKSIYKLHHDFLLPQLEQRMSEWEMVPRIGDIMKNFAPFLKMYIEYVKNFDNAMNTITNWATKQPRFAAILDDIHKMPECKYLTLQHHMLGPVQRVPRYELLLKDYLKKLPDDSPDKADTEIALHLISTVANRSNDAMKKIDEVKKLLEVQDMLGGAIDLINPTRELVKEGKIIKISARTGDHQERHLFLFNDMLLLCSQRLISNRVVSGPSFKVRAKLDVDSLLILEGDNLETANTFYVRNNQKSIELYTQTLEEKEEWMQELCKTVQELYRKKSSLRIASSTMQDCDLGRRPPSLLKLDLTTHCHGCSIQFSAFRRRHHCHACGNVVCNKCSSHKVPLAYDENKSNRVCNTCFTKLRSPDGLPLTPGAVSSPTSSWKENPDSPIQRKGVLEVKASDQSVIAGYLQLKTRGKTWVKRWFALHKDFVLYSFKSNEDRHAMTSMPVPGLTVGLPEKSDKLDSTEREHSFKLFHKKRIYYFQAKNKNDLSRWKSSLEKASRAELAS